MVPRWTAAAIVVVACLITGAGRTAPAAGPVEQDFVPACPLPFASTQDHHSIDAACTIAGDLTEDGPNQEQNRTKNNFCAGGTPVSATWFTFNRLQAKNDDLKRQPDPRDR
jgi:hypothetical protein